MNVKKLNPKVLSFLCLLLVVSIDQLTKALAPQQLIYFNEGLIFGSLSDLPSTIRVLTLCTLGGLFMTVYFFITYNLSKRLVWLHIGLALLLGGIMGNILDRTLLGKTIDFIPLKLGQSLVIFNFADLFLWAGAIIIAIKLITKEKVIWYPDNQRGRFLVLARDQVYFATKVTIFSFCSSLLISLFSLTFFRLTLRNEALGEAAIDLYVANLALGAFALTLLFCLLAFALSLYLSHKMAGPLYAFENYVEDLLDGKNRAFQLREGDRSQHLIKVAHELREHLHDQNCQK